MSNRAIKKRTYSVAYDFSETTAFKSYGVKHKRKSQYANYSGLPARGEYKHAYCSGQSYSAASVGVQSH